MYTLYYLLVAKTGSTLKRQMRPAWEGDRIRLDLTGETWGVRTYVGSMQLLGIGEVVDCAEVYVSRDE